MFFIIVSVYCGNYVVSKNNKPKLPKGPKSNNNLSEAFTPITQKELQQWNEGNYNEVEEVESEDPCVSCGEMKKSSELNKDDKCQSCSGA